MTRYFLPLALVLVFFIQTRCAQGQAIKIEGRTMGPIAYRVMIDPIPDSLDQQETANQIQQELDQVNNSMSTYLDESEISRFNRFTETDWFSVSESTAQVLSRALEISAETEGAFDVTVGPLVDLWKFGKDKADFQLPSENEIRNTLAMIGYQNLQVRMDPPSIKKTIPELRVDLSAIAKGFAVDQVAKKLNLLGIKSYMVEVGGEVRTRGLKGDGKPWQIAVELPESSSVGKYDQLAQLTDQSMATSGDYRNFHEINGKTYSHTIDPKTGSPVTHQMASISVLAKDCMSADAYATAALVLGPDRAQELLDQLNLEYQFTVRQASEFASTASSGFQVVEVKRPNPKANKKTSILPMFLGAAVIFGLAILGMATGAIFNNKPITGSCGGLSAQNGGGEDSSCSLCQKPTTECPDLAPKVASNETT